MNKLASRLASVFKVLYYFKYKSLKIWSGKDVGGGWGGKIQSLTHLKLLLGCRDVGLPQQQRDNKPNSLKDWDIGTLLIIKVFAGYFLPLLLSFSLQRECLCFTFFLILFLLGNTPNKLASWGSAAETAAVMTTATAHISVISITPGPLRALQSFQASFAIFCWRIRTCKKLKLTF